LAAVALESRESLYLSKSNTGRFNAFAIGNKKDRKDIIASLTFSAKNDIWLGEEGESENT